MLVYYDFLVYMEAKKRQTLERYWDIFSCDGKVGGWYFVRVEKCVQLKRTTRSNARCLSFGSRSLLIKFAGKGIKQRVKCNVDVTIFQEQRWYGTGMCTMDDKRDFTTAKISSYRGLPKLHEAEPRCLKETIIYLVW